jgi:hypothetical protein
MNINNLSIELKYPNRIGATLSIDERTNLELAVLKLSEERPFDQWNFWGRIEGLNRNYYIVQGLNQRGKYDFPEKKYFWRYLHSNSAHSHSSLPSCHNPGASSTKKPCCCETSLLANTRKSSSITPKGRRKLSVHNQYMQNTAMNSLLFQQKTSLSSTDYHV